MYEFKYIKHNKASLSHIKEKKEQRYLQIFSMNIKIKLRDSKDL